MFELLSLSSEIFYWFWVGEVKLLYFEGSSFIFCWGFEIFGGMFVFGNVVNSKDDFGSIKVNKLLCCFEFYFFVGVCDNDGLVGEVIVGFWGFDK